MLMQAKRKLPKGLSLLLAAILVLGMVLIPAKKTAAATKVSVGNLNVAGSAKSSTYTTGVNSGEQSFSFTMPANGTVELTYAYPSDEQPYVYVSDSSGKTVYYSTYYDEDKIGSDGSSVKVKHRFYTEFNKGQTYTLTIDKYSRSFNLAFCLLYAANSANLKSGKMIYGGSKQNSVSLYKIYVPKNGYLSVTFQDYCNATYPTYDIQLLNAKKKPLTNSFERISNSTTDTTTFGVKKGTYYLAVKGGSSSPIYTIKATAKAVKTKAGAKKAKAVTLKKGKSKKGVIYAKNKQTPAKHWYKFKVTKRKKVKLYINTKTSTGGSVLGKLKVVVTPAKGYGSADASLYYAKPKDALQLYTWGNKGKTLDPGIYYVCVSGYYYGNGYYTLKWK